MEKQCVVWQSFRRFANGPQPSHGRRRECLRQQGEDDPAALEAAVAHESLARLARQSSHLTPLTGLEP